MVLEKTLESPLDCKEIQPVYPKGNRPEYSLEGLRAGGGVTEDEMAGWHHQLNGPEFE